MAQQPEESMPDIAAPDVYAICALSDIEKGAAKSFSLSRVTEAGEQRPFAIFVVRTHGNEVFGYVNVCPHEGKWLNVGDGEFFSRDRAFLRCGRHGALFEIESGLCIAGGCKGASLEPVAVTVIDNEVCLCGVPLVEDQGPDPFREAEADETMDIMIHPE